VEYLPCYAPDLNPLEGLWANLKGVELANRACLSLEELAAAAEQGIGRVRGQSDLLFSFLHQLEFRTSPVVYSDGAGCSAAQLAGSPSSPTFLASR
jgi:hypothetical protein